MARWVASLFGALWLSVASASAHEVRPVYLDIKETAVGHYDVAWRVPITNGIAPPVLPRFSPQCIVRSSLPRSTGSAAITRMTLTCAKGLAGTEVKLDGLSRTMTDGLVRLQFATGEVTTRLLSPTEPAFKVPNASGVFDVFRTYVLLGIEHILSGWDHLLFVFGLMLLVRQTRPLILSLTSFTVAHSITLSLATLGIIHFPPPLVETLIALSILMLAVELARAHDKPGGAAGLRGPILAFGFGLLHGFGFAGALAKIGLPAHEIPMSLFAFNVGVEIGQILFIGLLLVLTLLVRAIRPQQKQLAFRVSTYVIGSLSAFWTIERILAFL